MRRLASATALAALLWLAAGSTASAQGQGPCFGVFPLDRRACEAAHHGPLTSLAGALTAFVALIATGSLGDVFGASREAANGDLDPVHGTATRPALDERPPAGGDEASRPRVQPLDPGLPPLDPLPPAQVLTQEVIDRWTALGADGEGRVTDRHGQHILTIDRDGRVTDLSGREIQGIAPEFAIDKFRDAAGRTIEYSASGQPHQRIETRAGPVFVPLSDLPGATTVRPDLDPTVGAQWTAMGAGPDGQLYGAGGRVIGRIDANGEMRTLDGTPIAAVMQPEGGRITEFTTGDGRTIRTGEPRPLPAAADAPAGDEDLRDLVRRTEQAEAERRVSQAADTNVGGDTPAGDTRPPTAPDGGVTQPPAGDTPPATPAGEATRPPAGDTRPPTAPDPTPTTRTPAGETPAAPPANAPAPADPAAPRPPRAPDDAPRPAETDADTGPRGMNTLTTLVDLQGKLDQIRQDIEAGKPPGEAIARAVADTWAGNALDPSNTGVKDVRMTLAASAMLPEGVNNVLPDQFVSNTVKTATELVAAIARDAGTSDATGTLHSAELDAFAERVAARRGADPFAGYGRAAQVVGEEMARADGDITQAIGNVMDDIRRIDEADAFSEAIDASATEFAAEAHAGKHGAVLRGLAEVAQVAGDPPAPAALGRDLATIARVLVDDTLGNDTSGGNTGGFGPGFWEDIAKQNNETVKSVPILGTVAGGYAEVASGIGDRGVQGFAEEMGEGAKALAEEGLALAADTGRRAADATAQYAAQTVQRIREWF